MGLIIGNRYRRHLHAQEVQQNDGFRIHETNSPNGQQSSISMNHIEAPVMAHAEYSNEPTIATADCQIVDVDSYSTGRNNKPLQTSAY